MFYAHTSAHGPEPLDDHLRFTECLAIKYGEKFQSSGLCALIARLHDLGKRTEKFQNVLAGKENHIDHAIVGAWYLNDEYFNCAQHYTDDAWIHALCCAAIRGHHSELCGRLISPSLDDLCLPDDDEYDIPLNSNGKRSALRDESEYDEVAAYAQTQKLLSHLSDGDYLTIDRTNPEARMLYARMVFSCLVDADYTATASFNSQHEPDAERVICPDEMLTKLHQYRNSIIRAAADSGKADLPINQLRNEIYRDAFIRGNGPVGFYTMTAPTGTAKTLALMEFALQQAKRNHFDRIIVVLPYLSIISQNAEEYRKAFGADTVLEDDSNTEFPEEVKLYADRWDAPVIVTTSVKFFETLGGNMAVPLRKLHHLANACVVFDECQTLPHQLTTCTIKMLQALPEYFHTTVLFSTATLPVYSYRRTLEHFQPVEIIENVKDTYQKYDQLKDTTVIPLDSPMTYESIWEKFIGVDQALIVFNTVNAALGMYHYIQDSLGSGSVFYLSSDLCSEHKQEIIRLVKRKLKNQEQCFLVSTQCIEAGVDLDFPSGAREYAPLSSVIQTAGRINRNGEHPGTFYVFGLGERNERRYPDITYQNESQVTEFLASEYGGLSLNDLSLMDAYYKRVYCGDREAGQDSLELQKACKYADVQAFSEQYHIIDDKNQIIVIVPYEQLSTEFDHLSAELQEQDYCISKVQMRSSKKIQVSRYASRKNMEFLRRHCHALFMRTSKYGERIPLNWMIADMDNIYNPQTGLQREESKDSFVF